MNKLSHTNTSKNIANPELCSGISGSELEYNSHKEVERISTGAKSLDNLLCGGIESKPVTEFYGESGSGKTQLCHTLCVIAPQEKCKGGVNGKAIYIDTEGKFRPERILAVAKCRGFDVDYTLANILCVRTMISQQQESYIHKLQSVMDKDNSIKLLIVDSVTNNYRAKFSAVYAFAERQKRLYKFMCGLSSLAQRYNIAVVVTNQVNFSGRLGAASPSGGSIMTHASTYRISLKRLRNNIAAKIVSSPYHPENGTYMMINEKGIDDVV
jgi:DNA repair protein RadA